MAGRTAPASGDAGAPADTSSAVVLFALFAAAVALRPQLVGAGPLIPAIQADLGLSHAVAGLLGSIPVLCMGLFAPVAPIAASRFGTAWAIRASLLCIGGFGILRGLAPEGWLVILLTAGVGMGMGLGGAVLPAAVKRYVPDRAVGGTVAYSAGLQLGSAASAALAVPLAAILDGWRGALLAFSVVTLFLLIPWRAIPAARPVPIEEGRHREVWPGVGAAQLAAVFALFGVVYYGLIAWLADAYVEFGWPAAAAGGLVATLNVASLLGTLTAAVVARGIGFTRALSALAVLFAIASTGFLLAPAAGLVWAAIAGYANGALFPLVLALPLRIAATPERVATLSAAMLGGGYTVAAISPVALGLLRDGAGTFRASLLAIAVAAGLFVVASSIVARRAEAAT